MTGRAITPTYSRDAERSVLGAILSAGSFGCGDRILERALATGLAGAHFALDSHRRLFELLLAQSRRGAGLDPLSAAAAIGEQATAVVVFSDLVDVDGLAARLWTIAAEVTAFSNVEHHAGIVRDLADVRAREEAA